ncbi:carboxypeptidase-like regulatory domain-containing protein [Niabella yanshanensis]|uniref:Carboxypeptidase-like regulatory domain-containing protein n=1 Tax=Niabella yanshanensis TaxID=577386 RepID=A0ABZ0W9C9_9BACT|nr:carboxypeptidase regulatory-like domain-containing protein [Niabella yanshanensis]WQD39893.1 carboxypeptidase-like regulatory domain-containing protein [Niabella yanshanensis]
MQQNNSTYPFYGPEDIKRYLSGSMSAQEMHDMEKAALKDPLLADAIDGFRGADPVITDTHLNAIKASILGLSQQEKPAAIPLNRSSKSHWWRWVAAACSLALIAGATWWVTQNVEPGAIQPLAKNETSQPADTVPAIATAPQVPIKEPVQADQATTPEKRAPIGMNSKLPEQQGASAKIPATTETFQSPAADQPADNLINTPLKEVMSAETKSLKKEQTNSYPYSREAISAAPPAPIVKSPDPSPANAKRMMGFQPVAYIQGQVVDKEGAPVANASISVPGRNKTTANDDGSFVLPVYDSSFGVSVNRVGYQNTTALLNPGKQNKIVLNKSFASPDEIVVTGMGQKRKKLTAYMEDARKAQAAAVSASEVIYPEDGWSHFYEELGTSLGVDKAKKTKTLQIKFTVDDNGDPVDFEVVESPDAIMAKKAIEFIKKAKWKNFKLDKNALVKIEVN